MAKSSTIYFLCGVSVFVNVGWIFLVTFLPTYLNKVHGFDLAQAGYLAGLIEKTPNSNSSLRFP